MKIWNKIILMIIFLCIYISNIYSDSIKLFSDKEKYDINNIINIVLEIDYFNKNSTESEKNIYESIDISNIKWLKEFQVNTYSKVFLEDKWVFMYSLSLTANQPWTYNIWPININNLKSNGLEFIVTWDRQVITNTTNLNPEETEYFSQDIDNINLSEYNENKVLDLDFKEMKDIYTIKQNESWSYFSYNSFKILIISLVLLISYFILEKYVFNNIFIKKEKFSPITKKKLIKNTINLREELNNIKNNSINNKDEFYSKLWILFRQYLEKEYWAEYNNISSKTFQEIEGGLDDDTYKIYKRIYFKEYDGNIDSIENRESIIEELNKII